MAEKVAEVCRDYCSVTWDAPLNNTKVPADSELRKAERMFYPKHIREISTNPSSAVLPSPTLEQVANAQGLPIDIGTSAGVGTGKEGPLPTGDAPSKDALTIRDVISQAKVAEKPKDGDSAKIAVTKEDPPPKKK